ncbi:MAG: protein-disulfide reductase DsbD family protein [Bacteroidota bacterium]|nr:protein-disulfide reductase DsbD family protein [Bacteroidota bacterium]
MKTFTFLFLFAFSLLLPDLGFSQAVLNPVKWEYSYEKITNTEGFILMKARIDKDWHIYSQHQSTDGPIPTSFLFTANADFDPIGKTEEPTADKAYSEVFSTEVISFGNEVVFKQKIKRKNLNSFDLNAELEFMACNNNTCLPPKVVKFSVRIPIAISGK